MKYYSLLLIIFLLGDFGCGDNCGECFSGPKPIRIAFLDSADKNLLNPSNPEHLSVLKVVSSSGMNIPFELKQSVGGFDTGFWFLESANRPNGLTCIDSECEFYISYLEESTIDTLNVYYEMRIEENENGCNCVYYPMVYIKFNGLTINEFNWEPNNTGAAIIRK